MFKPGARRWTGGKRRLLSEEKVETGVRKLGFTPHLHCFILHHISSWPLDRNERSRLLRIRVSRDGLDWAAQQLNGPHKEGNFLAVFVFGSDLCLLAQLNV